jgi:hypothetical protein
MLTYMHVRMQYVCTLRGAYCLYKQCRMSRFCFATYIHAQYICKCPCKKAQANNLRPNTTPQSKGRQIEDILPNQWVAPKRLANASITHRRGCSQRRAAVNVACEGHAVSANIITYVVHHACHSAITDSTHTYLHTSANTAHGKSMHVYFSIALPHMQTFTRT